MEPGRSLVGNAGVLLTRVEYLKLGETKHFAIVDAAMNDLMRPSLYDAWHDIVPVSQPTARRSWWTWSARCASPAIFWARPPAGGGRRRAAGGIVGRRLWFDHELQLQHPRPRGRKCWWKTASRA